MSDSLKAFEAAILLARQKAEASRSVDQLNAALVKIEQLRGALIWCSGSQDFQPGGIARDGWLELCKPLIDECARPDHQGDAPDV